MYWARTASCGWPCWAACGLGPGPPLPVVVMNATSHPVTEMLIKVAAWLTQGHRPDKLMSGGPRSRSAFGFAPIGRGRSAGRILGGSSADSGLFLGAGIGDLLPFVRREIDDGNLARPAASRLPGGLSQAGGGPSPKPRYEQRQAQHIRYKPRKDKENSTDDRAEAGHLQMHRPETVFGERRAGAVEVAAPGPPQQNQTRRPRWRGTGRSSTASRSAGRPGCTIAISAAGSNRRAIKAHLTKDIGPIPAWTLLAPRSGSSMVRPVRRPEPAVHSGSAR